MYERAVAKIHEVAGKDIWAKAYAEGQILTLSQAMALALQELSGKQA